MWDMKDLCLDPEMQVSSLCGTEEKQIILDLKHMMPVFPFNSSDGCNLLQYS